MVAGQPATAGDPAEGPLENPTPGLHREGFLALFEFDSLGIDGCGHADALALVGEVNRAVGQKRRVCARHEA